MDIKTLQNKLRQIIEDRYLGMGGYIDHDDLHIGEQCIPLSPLLGAFEKLQTSPFFTRLPPLFNATENFPISDMYVELTVAQSQGFADPLRINRGLSLAEEQEERHKQRRSRRLSMEQCVENPQHRNIVILGDPGSGKTSLLKYLCQHIAHDKSKRWVFPLFISLRQYWYDKQTADPSLTLLQFAAITLQSQKYGHGSSMFSHLPRESEEYKQTLREVTDIASVLSHISSSGREHILFLLDGLDEVASQPEAIHTISEEIRQLGYGFSWVLSSRYTGFYAGLGEDICYEVISLHKQGIEDLVNNWFEHTNPMSAEQNSTLILAQIQKNPRLKDMARNPFLLTLLCYVQNYNPQKLLPIQRSDIYNEIVKLIRLQLRTIKRDELLLRKTELDYLSKFCYYLYTDAKNAPLQLFEYDHWDACAEPDTPPDLKKHFLSSRLLNSWKQNGDFHFAHLTFQEYFIAIHLYQQPTNKVTSHLFNPQWKMVYRFLAGLYGKQLDTNNYQKLINSLLQPADKMGLLYIEAAWFLIEAGIENSNNIIGYDLRENLWDIWCRGHTYAGKSAGEALANLSPSYIIRRVIELLADEQNEKFTSKSISLLGYVHTIEADELLIELLQSENVKYQNSAINAIADKNTFDLRSQCLGLFQQNMAHYFLALCKLARASKHKDFLPLLMTCLEELPQSSFKHSLVYDAFTAIVSTEIDHYLLKLIRQYPAEKLPEELIEAFISLGTETVTTWLNSTIPQLEIEITKRHVIFHAIRYGLLSADDTIAALNGNNQESQVKYINAVNDQKILGIQPSFQVIKAIAGIAFSDTRNKVRAFSVLVLIDYHERELGKNGCLYLSEYRRFLRENDQEIVMGALSILADNKDIQSFKTILNFAKSRTNMGVKVEAIASLSKYQHSFPSEVKQTLHTIYQEEKEYSGVESSYYATEALTSLAKISLKELMPYYNDAEVQEVLTRLCAIEGILLFADYYIDRYGKKHSLNSEKMPVNLIKLDNSIDAIKQLSPLRSLCHYLLNNGDAKKSGNIRIKPIPLFNKKADTYDSINSVDIGTGNSFLKGNKISVEAASKLMSWMRDNFGWAFVSVDE